MMTVVKKKYMKACRFQKLVVQYLVTFQCSVLTQTLPSLLMLKVMMLFPRLNYLYLKKKKAWGSWPVS